MHRFLCATLALSASALLPACSQAALTELVVTVDTDYAVPGEIDHIEVVVDGPMGEERADGDTSGLGDLPVTLGVRATTGSPAVTVTATGTLDGVVVSRTVVRTSFLAGERRVLPLWLLRACAGCDTRCTETGGCEPSAVDPASLPAYTGTLSPHRTDDGGTGDDDSGISDGGPVDAGPPDGGRCIGREDCDDGLDCTTDSCVLGACAHDPLSEVDCTYGDGADTCPGRCSDGVCQAGADCGGDGGTPDAGEGGVADGGWRCFGIRDCNDGDSCTSDDCADGVCLHASLINGTECDDGNACTVFESCQAGRCGGGDARTCACACDPASGCTTGGPCT